LGSRTEVDAVRLLGAALALGGAVISGVGLYHYRRARQQLDAADERAVPLWLVEVVVIGVIAIAFAAALILLTP
jgi:uncharacterized membrane protein YidH (DUF202 family)